MSGISVRMRCGALAAVVALAGCGGGVEYRPVSDVPVRVGKPYSVRGVTYVPAADPGYDYLGYASWYGGESGQRTEEHTSEIQSLKRNPDSVFFLKQKKQ